MLFGRLPTERCAFGQHAAGHQLLGVIGAIACVTTLANFDATIIRVFALLGLAASFFWYVTCEHCLEFQLLAEDEIVKLRPFKNSP